jgi:hypothetical protein
MYANKKFKNIDVSRLKIQGGVAQIFAKIPGLLRQNLKGETLFWVLINDFFKNLPGRGTMVSFQQKCEKILN